MRNAYEALIGLIESREVCEETDTLLQNLGAEMLTGRPGGEAFREAVAYLVLDPATDPSEAARFVRLCHLCGIGLETPDAETVAEIVFRGRPTREAVAA